MLEQERVGTTHPVVIVSAKKELPERVVNFGVMRVKDQLTTQF